MMIILQLNIMKIIKKILLVFAIVLFVLCCYLQYMKHKFDKIYENRTSFQKYEVLYTSGVLNIFRDFVISNIDTISEIDRDESYGELAIYKDVIFLSDIYRFTKDTTIRQCIKAISDAGFGKLQIIKDKSEESMSLHFKKRFLEYKKVPTFQTIIYNENINSDSTFNKDDSWYFFSSDNQWDILDNFLDPRPEWVLPYFEAFDFFKRNPDY